MWKVATPQQDHGLAKHRALSHSPHVRGLHVPSRPVIRGTLHRAGTLRDLPSRLAEQHTETSRTSTNSWLLSLGRFANDGDEEWIWPLIGICQEDWVVDSKCPNSLQLWRTQASTQSDNTSKHLLEKKRRLRSQTGKLFQGLLHRWILTEG